MLVKIYYAILILLHVLAIEHSLISCVIFYPGFLVELIHTPIQKCIHTYIRKKIIHLYKSCYDGSMCIDKWCFAVGFALINKPHLNRLHLIVFNNRPIMYKSYIICPYIHTTYSDALVHVFSINICLYKHENIKIMCMPFL